MKKLKHITNILFKYATDNSDGKYNRNILLCQRKISKFLNNEKIFNEIQPYSINNQNRKIKHANLLAFNPKSTKSYILFQGHIDTVPSSNHFETIISSNLIQGRGAVDMKGPLAGMINTFVSLYKKPLKYSPLLLITGDEEANSFVGIKNFIKNNKRIVKKVSFAISGEPSNFKVHTSFRGVLGYKLQKEGKEGHSAYPDKVPLIEKMIPVITAINKFLNEARKVKDKKFGKTIGAFTVLNSGIKENQLPKNFEASWNLRTVKSKEVYMQLFRKMIKPVVPSKTKIKTFSFDPVFANIPAEYLKNVKNSFSKMRIKYKESPARYFTEATLMNNANIPTIVCGPGNPRLAHVEPQKEIITIKEIKKYSNLLQDIVNEFNDDYA